MDNVAATSTTGCPSGATEERNTQDGCASSFVYIWQAEASIPLPQGPQVVAGDSMVSCHQRIHRIHVPVQGFRVASRARQGAEIHVVDGKAGVRKHCQGRFLDIEAEAHERIDQMVVSGSL